MSHGPFLLRAIALGVLLVADVLAEDHRDNGLRRPVAARIMWSKDHEADPEHFGDVLVRYSDGSTAFWTRGGGCALPGVSPDGLVGWTHGAERNRTQGVMNNTLLIARQQHVFATIRVDEPFIDEWAFGDGSAVVVRSRGPHGPSTIQKFQIPGGRLLAQCPGSEIPEKAPDWARPFLDR